MVFAPNTTFPLDLRTIVAELLVHSIFGNWGEFPRGRESNKAENLFVRVVKSLIIGGLPLGFYLIFRTQIDAFLGFDASSTQPFLIFLSLWALAHVVLLIDPKAKDKLDLITSTFSAYYR